MNPSALLKAFESWRAAGHDLVLATVYETQGSTYSKAGAHMLIEAGGNFRGMLSGGCLEGDLAERAAQVLASNEAQGVTYDLTSSDEELWGMGVGCEGIMRIFLQPLRADGGYAPFAGIAETFAGDDAGAVAMVIESAHPSLRPGGSCLAAGTRRHAHGMAAEHTEVLDEGLRECVSGRRSSLRSIDVDGHACSVLFAYLQPPPRVLILGGGLDAEPVVRLAAELGWRITLQDHRPAYIARGDFERAEQVLQVPARDLAATVDLDRFDAVIVMSHHLQTDREYLRQLAAASIDYIGLLGPVDRRRRLLMELGEAGERLDGRVHGPAGLDIGGRGPASIALSIVAEMHQRLMQHDV